MAREDKLALILAVVAVLAAAFFANTIFEGMAHIEDEMAYVWQARVIAHSQLSIHTPEFPNHFLVPFVVDSNGLRSGKYPPGWPALLSLGVRADAKHWVNPLLAGLAIWLTYKLGERIRDKRLGLLAACLTITSPFFYLNSASFLSHAFGLVLSAAFALFWLDNFGEGQPKTLKTVTLGLLLGTFALTRPYSALAVGLPFGIHGVYLLFKGSKQSRQHVIAVGLLAGLLGSLILVWQLAVTGDAFTNPYTLWWAYDKVGFGPGFGRFGHDLSLARQITWESLLAGTHDLFGWGEFSWIMLPFGLWALRKAGKAWAVFAAFPSLVLFYAAYWIGATLFGPRYYYEGLYSLTLLSAAGILWLSGWWAKNAPRWRQWSVGVLVCGLVLYNLIYFLPMRMSSMKGLYGISRSMHAPFEKPEVQALAPAIIIVHPDRWTAYGGLLEWQTPFQNDFIIFVMTRNPVNDAAFAEHYVDSGRAIYHYYPDEPDRLYSEERP